MATFTTENFRRIEADSTGFEVTCTVSDVRMPVALTPDERRTLADALTEDLNTHHPKSGPVGNGGRYPDWMASVAPEMARVEREQRERAERAERERDAAVERAEAHAKGATRANLDRDKAYEELTAMTNRAEQAERDRDYARARLREVCSTPAVSRADIEKAVRSVGTMRRWIDDSELVDVPFAVDAVCDLFAIEAEQAVDPIEEKARVLWEAGRANPLLLDDQPANVRETFRRVAEYVLGQEASSDE